MKTGLTRRTLLTSAGLAACSPFFPAASEAQTTTTTPPMTEAEQANTRIVAGFCAAWSTRDLQRILPFLADDCIYRMTETTRAASGHAGVTERLGTWLQTSERVEFRILETFARGPMVVNHRSTGASRVQPMGRVRGGNPGRTGARGT